MGLPVFSVSLVHTKLDYEDEDDTVPIHDLLCMHPTEGVG